MPVAPGKKCSPYNFRFIQDDPLKVIRILWPKVLLSREQEQIAYSVWFNRETYVKAANQMGKDFIGGLIALVFYLTRHPCRVVTSSNTDKHLIVLWGEMEQFIATSKYPLTVEKGGPLLVQANHIYKWDYTTKDICGKSYIMKQVAGPDTLDAMGGHHIAWTNDMIPRTLFMADEASGVPTEFHKRTKPWRHRAFIFGNTWDCDNDFRWAFEGRPGTDDKGGDILSEDGTHYSRKCFSMKAEDSPNVRFAKAQMAAGKKPTGEIIVPGLKPWHEYVEHRRSWDPIQQCVGLDAEWYKGKEVKLFPQEWLDRAVEIGRNMRGSKRMARAMGIDPAEGGDWTCYCVVDEYGIIELLRHKTPDTADVTDMAKFLIDKYSLEPRKCFFDSGGGGKQHSDRMRREGYPTMAVAFKESVVREPQRMKILYPEKVDLKEDKGAYANRRCMMYGEAAILLDPIKPRNRVFSQEEGEPGQLSVEGIQMFGIPPDGPQYGELLRQLAAMPKKYVEGQLYLPPKSRKSDNATSKAEKTLTELLGRSPDEADSFVLAVYAMTGKRAVPMVRGYS